MIGSAHQELGVSGVRQTLRTGVAVAAMALLGACSSVNFPALKNIAPKPATQLAVVEPAPAVAAGPAHLDPLIAKYSAQYNVPESLIRRVIVRESGYNPKARNGPYYGLMQISYATAQSMGYRGAASGLLDADTNLKYAVKYLSGAYLVGGHNADQAVRNYSRGYYYDAKRQGLLEEVGLR
jgi:soluble lytic murein transglycosylase-like protein